MLSNFRDICAEADPVLPRRRCYRARAAAGVAADCPTFGDYGIRTVIDLRAPEEVAPDSLALPEGVARRQHPLGWAGRSDEERRRLQRWGRLLDHLLRPTTSDQRFDRLRPVLDGMLDRAGAASAESGAAGYFEICRHNRGSVRAVFETIAQPETPPFVIVCARGNDRTGVVVALLLRVLGASDEAILRDYGASNQAFLADPPLDPETVSRLAEAGVQLVDLIPILGVDVQAMKIFLAQLAERYVDSDSYLAGEIGVPAAVLDAVRANLRA